MDDNHLRKVSISANEFLFNESFEENQKVFDLLKQLKNRYRIFLITQVVTDGGLQHEAAKQSIKKLVDAKVVKEHRAMFCTTQKGKEAIVRQLGAELHVETDEQIVKSLVNVMNKFHVIKPPAMSDEIDSLAKQHPRKMVLFKGAGAYAKKILAGLQ